jgi:hypothetical protein
MKKQASEEAAHVESMLFTGVCLSILGIVCADKKTAFRIFKQLDGMDN